MARSWLSRGMNFTADKQEQRGTLWSRAIGQSELISQFIRGRAFAIESGLFLLIDGPFLETQTGCADPLPAQFLVLKIGPRRKQGSLTGMT